MCRRGLCGWKWMKILLEARNKEDKIAPMAFAEREDLTEVIIGEGITEIGAGAFLGCRSLRSVHFPESLRVIGEMAFWESGLYEVTLPEGLQCVGENAFWSCEDLSRILVPGKDTAIGLNAFGGCERLLEGCVARGYPGPEACDPPAELLYTLLLLSSGEQFPAEAEERAVRYAREYEDLLIERILAANGRSALEGMVRRKLLTPEKIPDYVKAAAKAKRPEIAAVLLRASSGSRGGAAGRFAH